MSWAALNEQLLGLLPLFAAPTDPTTAGRLHSGVIGLVDGLVAHSDIEPTAAEAEAFRG